MTITEPIEGIYDLTDADYLADPVPCGSLSATGAKLLVDCPAKYHHQQTAGSDTADHFDFGTAAHATLLGKGADIAVLNFDDRRTKAYKEAEAEARAAGRTPMLAGTYATVVDMVAAVGDNPAARRLFDAVGPVEHSFIWFDRCWRRAKLDKYVTLSNGRVVVVDYKTTTDASPNGFMKSSASYGYYQQAAWYLDAARRLLGAADPAFVFIVQEKAPPYITSVFELVGSYLAIGEHRNEIAVDRYLHGQKTGEWPTYSSRVERIAAPRWLEIEHEEEMQRREEGDAT